MGLAALRLAFSLFASSSSGTLPQGPEPLVPPPADAPELELRFLAEVSLNAPGPAEGEDPRATDDRDRLSKYGAIHFARVGRVLVRDDVDGDVHVFDEAGERLFVCESPVPSRGWTFLDLGTDELGDVIVERNGLDPVLDVFDRPRRPSMSCCLAANGQPDPDPTVGIYLFDATGQLEHRVLQPQGLEFASTLIAGAWLVYLPDEERGAIHLLDLDRHELRRVHSAAPLPCKTFWGAPERSRLDELWCVDEGEHRQLRLALPRHER